MPPTTFRRVEDQSARDQAMLQSALAIALLRHGELTFTIDELDTIRDTTFAVQHTHPDGKCTLSIQLASTPPELRDGDEAPVQ